MPIPGSVLSSLFPFGLSAAIRMYPSLATLRPLTKTTDTTGQDLLSFEDSNVEGQFDLPCRKSPLILIRPQKQEYDRVGVQQYDGEYQVNISTYIAVDAAVLAEWQVKVDGIVYQIHSVESDGNGLTTRLMVAQVIPYGIAEPEATDGITMDDVVNMDDIIDMDTLEEVV